MGYRVRLDNKVSQHTRLEYVTVGLLLRKLTADPNPVPDITHIIVDEVHERSADIDFLLLCLKALVCRSFCLALFFAVFLSLYDAQPRLPYTTYAATYITCTTDTTYVYVSGE